MGSNLRDRTPPVVDEPRTLGEIARKYGVTVAEAARAYPFAPGAGFAPFSPAPPVRVVEVPKPLTADEAAALVEHLERGRRSGFTCEDCEAWNELDVDDGNHGRGHSVVLASALDKLRRLAGA